MNENFDRHLRGQLSAEDEAFLDQLEDNRGLYAQLSDTFHGPMRYWTVFAFVFSFLMFIASAYMFWRLMGETDPRNALLWLTGVLALLNGVGLIKVWFWMRMNQLALLRELKKIELQVSRLQT